MINTAIAKLAAGQNLAGTETREAFDQIMSGGATNAQIAAFITAMRMKGETIDEITACVQVLREKCSRIHTQGDVLDIVGTGGDKSNSFNISTTSAFVAACAGVTIVKHGNRAASSKCGTADCLEALGVKIDCESELMKKSLDENNIAFLFAQKYHTAMRFVGPVRKQIGIRTVFNILGPLTNPGKADRMVLGVFSEEYVEKIAKALVKIGVTDAMVVYGMDCLDEISASAETKVAEVRGKNILYYTIKPEDFGFERVNKDDLIGGTPEENAKITTAILQGKGTAAQNTAVALNAGAAIYAGILGISLADAVKKAQDIITSGEAYKVLENFVKVTNE